MLIVDRAETFPDNWIYIHEPEVHLGRIQNFKNWSPVLVPDHSKSSLGLEYFCFEGDGLWTMPDADLIELGRKEIDAIGLVKAYDVVDGCVVRMPKAYPVYDDEYQESRRDPRLAGPVRKPGTGGSKRDAQVQQPGPFDDDRAARGPEHPGPGPVRHLEGQHRRRVPRGGAADGAQAEGVGRAVPQRITSA